MALAVGITGGIGSGKSTVSKVFSLLGTPVFEADREAKVLMNTNEKLKKELTALCGIEIYTSDGILDRKKLAALIFDNELLLRKVNDLVHPEVRQAFVNWKVEQQTPYIIHEAAILFESGFYDMMDYTILVTAPEEARIKRITGRDGITEAEIRSRMARQWNDDKKRKLASIELVNDNSSLIIPQILEIDRKLRTNGKIW